MPTIPDYSGRTFLSASTHNAWRDALLEFFSRASAPVLPFSQYNDSTASAGDEADYVYSGTTSVAWRGRILYTGLTDSFYYDFNNFGTDTTSYLIINETTVLTTSFQGDVTGTYDMSPLNLTPGQTYEVRIEGQRNTGADGAVTPHWFGLHYTPSYTAPPSFASSITAAQLSDLYDGLTEINELMDLPQSLFPYEEVSRSVLDDNDYVVWNGQIYHAHDTLSYRIYNPESNAEFSIHIDGSEVVSVQNNGNDYYEGDIDISGESLTVGTKYDLQVKQNRFGSSGSETLTTGVVWLCQKSDLNPVAVTDWAQGDLVTSATPHDWLKDMINRIHPGSATVDVPLLYRTPATKRPSSNKFYGLRSKPYLKYEADGSGTPEIDPKLSSIDEQSLSSGSGIQTFDFNDYLELSPGKYYEIDDVFYAQEADVA